MDTPQVGLWRRAEALFEQALERSTSQRQGFVEQACVGDHELRTAVASLLANDEMAPKVTGFAERPPESREEGLWTGRRLGVYRLLRPLGHGGMGLVYLGERDDGEVEQRVAVKLIREGGNRPALLRRFRRERQILARLSHPNIAHFLDGGTTETCWPYVVLEYIEGLPITEYCDVRRLSIRQRLRLMLQVCRAVEHAHRNLIVHSDLKPGNILVTDQGDVKLLDFGIAKLLETSRAEVQEITAIQDRFFTPNYASPEQLAGEAVTTAVDQYALGVLLYRLLTGQMPLESAGGPLPPSAAAVTEQPSGAKHATESPSGRAQARGTTPGRLGRQLRGDLDNIILRCLRRDPQHRYGSIEKVAEDLRRHLDGRPVEARPIGFFYRFAKFARRHAAAAAAAAVVLITLVAFVFLTLEQSRRVGRERDLANQARSEAEEVTRFLADAFRQANPFLRTDPSRAGRDVTAREILDAAATRVERELRNQPLVQARLMNTIGAVYVDLGVLDKGQALLRGALETRRQRFGSDHPDVVDSLNSLGSALGRAGHNDHAETMFRQALAISRSLEIPGLTAQSLSNLGCLLRDRGDYSSAEPLLREALALTRRSSAGEDRETATRMTDLALLRQRTGDLDGAESLLQEALLMLRRVVGQPHPSVAEVLSSQARLLTERDDLAAAEVLFREALAMRRAVLGNEHPATLESLGELGDILYFRGELEKAEAVMRETLALDRRIKGPTHPDVATTLNNMGMLLWDRYGPAEAEPSFREALAVGQAQLGLKHRRIASYHFNLGRALHDLGDRPGAESHLKQALAIRRELFGSAHTKVGDSLLALADLLAEAGRGSEALPLATEAVTVIARSRLPDHWHQSAARSVLGACLVDSAQYEEAEPLLLEGLAGVEKARGTTSWPARRALRRVVDLYEAWGRADHAEAFRARLATAE